MDNVAGMSLMDDNSVDLTVTSPPYDDLRNYKGYSWDFNNVAKQLYRVTKPGGVVVWVVGDSTKDGCESLTSFGQAIYFKDLGFNVETMIYRKINGAMGSRYTYLQEFEYMFVFSKGYPKTVNFIRDRKNVRSGFEKRPATKSDANGSKNDRIDVYSEEYGRRKNIWEYAVGGKQKFGRHPGVFPEKLVLDHILTWSNEGDLILDPFMGSGTTAKVAKSNNRNFIGFEISQEYCDIANSRLKA